MYMYEVEERNPNFELYPMKKIDCKYVFSGFQVIVDELKKHIVKPSTVICIDYYYGVNQTLIEKEIINALNPDHVICVDEAKYPEEVISKKFHCFITDDRVNGVFSFAKIQEFFDPDKIALLQKQIHEEEGLIVVYGVGAGLIHAGDLSVYGSMSYQTIKNRFMDGMDNWGAQNYEEEYLRKEKRFTFLESRVLDKHKRAILKNCDYVIDCNRDNDFVMLTHKDYDYMIHQFVTSPFKPIPIFSKGVWGGHWCQKVLGAGLELENTAWGITGFLDWQAVAAEINHCVFEFPSTDLIQYAPKELLGYKIWYLYGYRCPLHVNFLDTWGGENLSLQVHPTLAYAQEEFNSSWGHYESYYFLDANENSSVYLGTKDGVQLDELVDAFETAQVTGQFDDEKYINNFPVQKHDHVFIPGGTIHSSGKDTLTLEIDMFCFTTFKLWDWGRLDYDGKPRPIHIEHGKNVIQEEFQTQMIKDQFISQHPEVDSGYGWRKERSGTMPFEAPMEVNRYWFKNVIHFDTNDCIMIHVLVEGEEAIIESLDESFEPMVIHYAEAVFVPAAAGQYTIRPYGKSQNTECALLEIYMDI